MKVTALDLHKIDKGAVIGTFTVWLPEFDLRIYEVLWDRRGEGGAEWVRLPTRQWTGNEGATHYNKLFAWGSERSSRDFEQAALEAIHTLAAREAERA